MYRSFRILSFSLSLSLSISLSLSLYIYIYIYIYIYTHISGVSPTISRTPSTWQAQNYVARYGYGRFPKIHRVFVGPRPWHIEIRHRVENTSTISLFGFETLKLKIRRLKLWKPTVDNRLWSTLQRRRSSHETGDT